MTADHKRFRCGGLEGSNVVICKCNRISVVLKFPADRKIEPEAVVSSTHLVRSCAYEHKYYFFEKITFSAKPVISFSTFGPRQNTAVTQGLPKTMKLIALEGQFEP